MLHFCCRSIAEIDRYFKENEITIQGRDVPDPIMYFDEVNFPDFIVSEIRYARYIYYYLS